VPFLRKGKGVENVQEARKLSGPAPTSKIHPIPPNPKYPFK
jgi:hypothetical protein